MRNFVFCLLLIGSLAPSLLAAQSRDSLQLRAGDVIDIQVYARPELSGEFRVAASGVLADPYYSDVSVVGIPFTLAAERIRTFIRQTEADPRVWVEPRYRVAILGATGSPGFQVVGEATTLGEALLQAGGVSAQGRANRVELHRDGEVTILDLRDPLGPNGSILVRSGDRIFIPSRPRPLREIILPYTTTVSAVASVVLLYLRFR